MLKPTIEYTDFEKIEFRVGQIIAATEPEWSNKLLQFTVDFGPEIGERTILSGVRKWYKPVDFIGKKFPFIINLAERKMGEGVSQGMMFMADAVIDGEEKAIAVPIDESVPVGAVLR